ncbi:MULTISPECIES: lysylphosphatidylglycerol synthase transmembrane domain-containing protein [Bordetella]|uniref:lysylphosphatidylglycerol synthase transmembrane domain-containing protein n=1 Tax=Bordetella TaxID=517 RepID=UPI00081CD025|nr:MULTISPECIES: lysylphosphatidylglycerol synthase transmembrane domain-containing protein [Bordetella]AOB24874.1 hypothetical protein BBB44_00625 [Bordetella bronchiseptica]
MKYRILFLVILIAIAWHNLDPAAVLDHLDPTVLISMAAAQPALVLSFLFVGARLAVILRQPVRNVPVVTAATLLSQALNLVIPGRLSELLKVTYLRAQLDIPNARTFAGVFVERVMDLALLGLMALATLSMIKNEWATTISIGLLVAALVAVVVFLWLAPRIAALLESKGWRRLAQAIGNLHFELGRMLTWRTLAGAAALGTLAWACSLLSIYAYLDVALEQPISIELALWVLIMASVGGSIPALPGGFGAYEAAVVFVLTRAGVGFEQALVTSLGLHISQYVLSGIVALFLLIGQRTGVRQLLRDLLAR